MNMIRLILSFVVLALAVPIVSSSQAPTIKLAHCVSGGPALDIFVDTMQTASITNLDYRGAAQQLNLTPGDHKFIATFVGGSPSLPLLTANFTTNSDSAYTVCAYGSVSSSIATYTVLARGINTKPSQNKAYIRFLHGCADAPLYTAKIKDVLGTTITIPSIGFGENNDLHEIAGGVVTLELYDPSNKLAYKGTTNVTAGTMVLLIATGETTSSPPSFGVNVMLEDNPNAQKPMPLMTALSGVSTDSEAQTIHCVATPNPCSESCIVRYALPKSGRVRAVVYTMLGTKIIATEPVQQSAGQVSTTIPTDGFVSGTYLIRVERNDGTFVGKTVLVKQ